jgi:hypothetical protein
MAAPIFRSSALRGSPAFRTSPSGFWVEHPEQHGNERSFRYSRKFWKLHIRTGQLDLCVDAVTVSKSKLVLKTSKHSIDKYRRVRCDAKSLSRARNSSHGLIKEGKREEHNMKTLILAGCALLALSALAHADSLPKTMLGNWCAVSESEDLYIRKACPNSGGKLTVRQNEYVFWESGCEIKRVQRQARAAYLVQGSCSGEGTHWTAKSEFELIGNRLSIRVISSTKPIPETIGRSR